VYARNNSPRGKFSTVRLGREIASGDEHAVKIIDKRKFPDTNRIASNVLNETEILRRLHHPNIIRFKDFFETPTHYLIIMEL
jgi:serine/threonine protein kinase